MTRNLEHIGGPTAAQLDDADLARCPGCERCVDAAEVEDTGLCSDCYRAMMVAGVVAGTRCVCCWALKADCGYARVSTPAIVRDDGDVAHQIEREAGGY